MRAAMNTFASAPGVAEGISMVSALSSRSPASAPGEAFAPNADTLADTPLPDANPEDNDIQARFQAALEGYMEAKQARQDCEFAVECLNSDFAKRAAYMDVQTQKRREQAERAEAIIQQSAEEGEELEAKIARLQAELGEVNSKLEVSRGVTQRLMLKLRDMQYEKEKQEREMENKHLLPEKEEVAAAPLETPPAEEEVAQAEEAEEAEEPSAEEVVEAPMAEEPPAEPMEDEVLVVTSMSTPAAAGDTKLEVGSTEGVEAGRVIRLNPGNDTEEDAVITGFGSLLLRDPLKFAHYPGEVVQQLPKAAGEAVLQAMAMMGLGGEDTKAAAPEAGPEDTSPPDPEPVATEPEPQSRGRERQRPEEQEPQLARDRTSPSDIAGRAGEEGYVEDLSQQFDVPDTPKLPPERAGSTIPVGTRYSGEMSPPKQRPVNASEEPEPVPPPSAPPPSTPADTPRSLPEEEAAVEEAPVEEEAETKPVPPTEAPVAEPEVNASAAEYLAGRVDAEAFADRKQAKERELVQTCISGAVMFKYNKAGKMAFFKKKEESKREAKWVMLSPDQKSLQWGELKKKPKASTSVTLAECTAFSYGYGSPVFAGMMVKPDPEHLCFSLHMKDKTHDFAVNEGEAEAWVVTLSKLAPGTEISRGQFLWRYLQLKMGAQMESTSFVGIVTQMAASLEAELAAEEGTSGVAPIPGLSGNLAATGRQQSREGKDYSGGVGIEGETNQEAMARVRSKGSMTPIQDAPRE